MMKFLLRLSVILCLIVSGSCQGKELPEQPQKEQPAPQPVPPEVDPQPDPPAPLDIPAVLPASLQVKSSEETFPMRRSTETSHLFFGVSSFTEAEEVVFTGVDEDGEEFSFAGPSPISGPVWLEVNFDQRTYQFLEMPVVLAQGSAVKGISNQRGGELTYVGHGIYSGTGLVFDADGFPKYDRTLSFSFVRKGAWSPAFGQVPGTRREIEWTRSTVQTQEIILNPGCYDISLDLRSYCFSISHSGELDANRITVMGSSVPYGQGATDRYGYIQRFGDILKSQSAYPWYISNLSVPGDQTTKLGVRFDEQTVDGGKTLVIALSLGNEGLASASTEEARRALYEQWTGRVYLNDDSFVKTALAEGKNVIVTGNYAKGNYTTDHYAWIRKINLDIHQWDLPSVNLMGTIDNGAGKWTEGYYADKSHPNDDGHTEMSYAWVPSLLDALRAGKAQPQRDVQGRLDLAQGEALKLTPQGTLHSFTVSFGILMSEAGRILTLDAGDESRNLSVSPEGALTYRGLLTSARVKDGQWHQIALTHFYARGETCLYVDGALQGSVGEQLAPKTLYVGGTDAAISLREVFLYRSGMNADEMAALQEGKMLKSSLEVYAPLNGSLDNLAQSTAVLVRTAAPDQPVEKRICVLAIGNSFSVDAMQYLYDILAEGGSTDIILGNLYIGGCSLQTHAEHFTNNDAAYTYYKNTSGTWTSTKSFQPLEALSEYDWDYISLQQSSPLSGKPDSYDPYMGQLLSIAKSYCPNAKFVWHMTWAYQGNSTHKAFPDYGSDQMQMYADIVSAVQSKVVSNGSFTHVIPSGTSIQNLRTSFYGDTLTRDGYHLSYEVGRYVAALTWAAVLAEVDPESVLWSPPQYVYTAKELAAIKEAVKNAVAYPYQVTQSSYKESVSGQTGTAGLQDFNTIGGYDWTH